MGVWARWCSEAPSKSGFSSTRKVSGREIAAITTAWAGTIGCRRCGDCFLPDSTRRRRRSWIGKSSASARVSADSGDAAPVLSGQTRSVHGEGGVRPERTVPGVHRWLSEALPATLTLAWDAPQTFREVRLVFDTGLHRELTFTLCDALARRLMWGLAQPETVRDYVIEACLGGTWVPLCEVTGNFLRQRVHRFPADVTASALRVRVLATNGDLKARICEVRVYA